MIYRVLEYADGLPLAIEMLGASFFGKSVAEWRSFLDREEIIPPYEIIRVLRKSFDELDHMSKEMFLDIACFFVGKDINCVKEILHDCFSCSVNTEILIRKSVITIANERIQMHNMLQAMGRDISRRQYLHQQSRLYLYSDIKSVMEKKRNTVMENVEAQLDDIESVSERQRYTSMVEGVEAIALDLEEPKMASLRVDALSDMINLRLLIFRNVEFSGTLSNLSSTLRYVSWHQYPFTSLPSSFQSDTLVQLIMPESNMTEVWKGRMMLPALRKLNLSGSKTLTKTPDFGGAPDLERLELEGCTGLLQLDPSVAKLPKLRFLNLKGCINLVSIPNSMFCLNSLGKKYVEKGQGGIVSWEEFRHLVDEFFFLNNGFANIGDVFPLINFLDLRGHIKRMKDFSGKFDRFMEHVLDE
ncbi:disease resistance protein RRS1B-like [Neltuma alba]|uniref:disease resistance protein RRS1B-like n=1 Tax=Neltuma alba TaxID=207710 RepID=UPI0010A480B2|nr:disease resistance protein RRS1B-like [Prosopis alba]